MPLNETPDEHPTEEIAIDPRTCLISGVLETGPWIIDDSDEIPGEPPHSQPADHPFPTTAAASTSTTGAHARDGNRAPGNTPRTMWLLRRYEHDTESLRETVTLHSRHVHAIKTLAEHIRHQLALPSSDGTPAADLVSGYFVTDEPRRTTPRTGGTRFDQEHRPREWYTLSALTITDTGDDEVQFRHATLRVLDEDPYDPYENPLTYHLDSPLGIAVSLHPTHGGGVAVHLRPSEGPTVPHLPVTVALVTSSGTVHHDHHLP